MTDTLKNRRVFLVGGSGGVGKTTVAASLGVKFAKQGYRTMVLTVDPARRLAQALGLESFSGEIQRVHLPDDPKAALFTTMLDAQRDFDRIFYRFCKDEAQRDRILNSRAYRLMVGSLGGTHEYAAMERLLEFTKNPEFDRIVIDTPPSQNAVDLFSAPERMAEFMDNSVLKWFQGGPKVFSLFKQGTKLAMKALEIVFGNEFIEEFSNVLKDFEGLQAGFRSRNLEVMEILRSEATAFLLVTYPSEIRYRESVDFLTTLKRYEVPVRGLVLNRLEPYSADCLPHSIHCSDEVRNLVDPILSYFHQLFEEQKTWVSQFSTLLPHQPVFQIPRQTTPLHDVRSLGDLPGLTGNGL